MAKSKAVKRAEALERKRIHSGRTFGQKLERAGEREKKRLLSSVGWKSAKPEPKFGAGDQAVYDMLTQ